MAAPDTFKPARSLAGQLFDEIDPARLDRVGAKSFKLVIHARDSRSTAACLFIDEQLRRPNPG
jgi:hypothetical protein